MGLWLLFLPAFYAKLVLIPTVALTLVITALSFGGLGIHTIGYETDYLALPRAVYNLLPHTHAFDILDPAKREEAFFPARVLWHNGIPNITAHPPFKAVGYNLSAENATNTSAGPYSYASFFSRVNTGLDEKPQDSWWWRVAAVVAGWLASGVRAGLVFAFFLGVQAIWSIVSAWCGWIFALVALYYALETLVLITQIQMHKSQKNLLADYDDVLKTTRIKGRPAGRLGLAFCILIGSTIKSIFFTGTLWANAISIFSGKFWKDLGGMCDDILVASTSAPSREESSLLMAEFKNFLGVLYYQCGCPGYNNEQAFSDGAFIFGLLRTHALKHDNHYLVQPVDRDNNDVLPNGSYLGFQVSDIDEDKSTVRVRIFNRYLQKVAPHTELSHEQIGALHLRGVDGGAEAGRPAWQTPAEGTRLTMVPLVGGATKDTFLYKTTSPKQESKKEQPPVAAEAVTKKQQPVKGRALVSTDLATDAMLQRCLPAIRAAIRDEYAASRRRAGSRDSSASSGSGTSSASGASSRSASSNTSKKSTSTSTGKKKDEDAAANAAAMAGNTSTAPAASSKGRSRKSKRAPVAAHNEDRAGGTITLGGETVTTDDNGCWGATVAVVAHVVAEAAPEWTARRGGKVDIDEDDLLFNFQDKKWVASHGADKIIELAGAEPMRGKPNCANLVLSKVVRAIDRQQKNTAHILCHGTTMPRGVQPIAALLHYKLDGVPHVSPATAIRAEADTIVYVWLRQLQGATPSGKCGCGKAASRHKDNEHKATCAACQKVFYGACCESRSLTNLLIEEGDDVQWRCHGCIEADAALHADSQVKKMIDYVSDRIKKAAAGDAAARASFGPNFHELIMGPSGMLLTPLLATPPRASILFGADARWL